MKEATAKPSLRISHIVYGRQHSGNRVTYLVDPRGQGTLRAVPEAVVLKRWRQRKFSDHIFSGARLSSTLWRAVASSLGTDTAKTCAMSLPDLTFKVESSRPSLGVLKLPSAETLHVMFAVCGAARLSSILARHLSPEHAGKSGVPDLFLYAIQATTRRPAIARFVEVKKPEEKVSRTQLDEIEFLNSLGLHSRVLRLVDRALPAANLGLDLDRPSL
jgi:hypothetical protein